MSRSKEIPAFEIRDAAGRLVIGIHRNGEVEGMSVDGKTIINRIPLLIAAARAGTA